jgi:hypothetical protein
MATLFEASRGNRPSTQPHWRDELMVARFRTAEFHVESASMENGRRIVMHEFPKKEEPYAEDMGRRAKEFSVRGYCIVYPFDSDELFQRDYRKPRDKLMAALEQEGRGVLQLPTFRPMVVVCESYRVAEEQKTGGYCVFDMKFNEFGYPPTLVRVGSDAQVQTAADALQRATARRLSQIQQAERLLGRQIAEAMAPASVIAPPGSGTGGRGFVPLPPPGSGTGGRGLPAFEE